MCSATGGAYVFTVSTYNNFPPVTPCSADNEFANYYMPPPNPANVVLQLTATGMNAGEDEKVTAYNIWNQLNTQLTQYGAQYSGSPIFSSQVPYPTFRIYQSSHVISFFSESLFNITVAASGIDPGCIVNISDRPTLVTVEQCNALAPFASVMLRDIFGNVISNSGLSLALQIASARLIMGLKGNNIVVATFLTEEAGYYQTGLWLRRGIPGIFFDPVRVKRPYSVSLFGTIVGDSTSIVWNYKRDQGFLEYIPSQNLINTYEPTYLKNEIKVSYTAGNWTIPPQIIDGVVRLLGGSLQSRSGYKSLKTGSFSAAYIDKTLLQEICEELRDEFAL